MEEMLDSVNKNIPDEYPLVNFHIAMENRPIFHGKIHYFYGHFPLLFVSSPEGNTVTNRYDGIHRASDIRDEFSLRNGDASPSMHHHDIVEEMRF